MDTGAMDQGSDMDTGAMGTGVMGQGSDMDTGFLDRGGSDGLQRLSLNLGARLLGGGFLGGWLGGCWRAGLAAACGELLPGREARFSRLAGPGWRGRRRPCGAVRG